MSWEDVLKIRGAKFDGTEVDADPKEVINYLAYRNWAWQSQKARDSEGLAGEGYDDKEHLKLITTPKGRMYYNPKNVKSWIKTWNEEFGRRLGAIYPTGDE